MKHLKEYLDEETKYRHNNVIIKFTMKGDKGNFDTHIEKRLADRSDLTLDIFKKKLNKFVDSIIKDFDQSNGVYLCIFTKSNVKVLLKFTKNTNKGKLKGTVITITVLDINMKVKNYDYAISLNENVDYLFNQYDVDIENNEYYLYDVEENDENMEYSIGFIKEDNVKKIDFGVEIIELNI